VTKGHVLSLILSLLEPFDEKTAKFRPPLNHLIYFIAEVFCNKKYPLNKARSSFYSRSGGGVRKEKEILVVYIRGGSLSSRLSPYYPLDKPHALRFQFPLY